MSKRTKRFKTPPTITNHKQNHLSIERRQVFQGPLPPPAILEGYNKLVPNAAERILQMAERQSEHRIEMEKKVVASNIKNSNRGTIFAFIIAMSTIIGGIVIILRNHSTEGLALIISSLGVLTGIFITGKYFQKRNAEKGRVNE